MAKLPTFLASVNLGYRRNFPSTDWKMQHATVEGDDDGTQENGDVNPETDATFEDMQNNWISNHEKLHGILIQTTTSQQHRFIGMYSSIYGVHTGTTLVI